MYHQKLPNHNPQARSALCTLVQTAWGVTHYLKVKSGKISFHHFHLVYRPNGFAAARGDIAPSRCVPQTHDQTREISQFFSFSRIAAPQLKTMFVLMLSQCSFWRYCHDNNVKNYNYVAMESFSRSVVPQYEIIENWGGNTIRENARKRGRKNKDYAAATRPTEQRWRAADRLHHHIWGGYDE